jgi:bifunctional non-homologous end joining protein LigD
MRTATSSVDVDGRRIGLTNHDRVLWPRTGFTKGDLIGYYRDVAPALLPHLAGRPVTLGRWPRGVERRGFAQTECRGRPSWLRTAELRLREGEVRRHCLVEDAASLVWVANLATVELHAYPFLFERPDEPTSVPLDLDPGSGAAPTAIAEAALLVRDALAELGLAAAVKTSGSVGLHVHVPLGRPTSAATVEAFAARLAGELATSHPGLVTDDRRPEARRGRVLVDWMQARPRRLMAAPYSLRATPEPAVSAPLLWEDVEAAAARPGELSLGPSAVQARIAEHGDLFASALETRQELPVP